MEENYRFERYRNLKRDAREGININPIQTGGRLTEAAKKALLEYGDGYSVCDYCEGNLFEIRKPDIKTFREDLAKFVGADEVVFTHGAREAIYLVLSSILKKGDSIVVDENRHYTTDLAVEKCGLNKILVKNSGYPEFKIRVEDYIPAIEKHKPKAILLTYPDGEFGNLPDAKKLGKIAKEYGIPFIVNGAYSIGRMPVNMKELGADFIIGSGHKSMASSGPIGILGISARFEEKILQPSKTVKNKFCSILGCTVRGVPIITLMASFPEVVKRVSNWEEEVKKARYFCEKFEEMGNGKIRLLGEKPHNHDLMKFETPLFFEISKKHPYGREFLYRILKKHGIFGIKHGITKYLKISTYGLSYDEIDYVLSVFEKIIKGEV